MVGIVLNHGIGEVALVGVWVEIPLLAFFSTTVFWKLLCLLHGSISSTSGTGSTSTSSASSTITSSCTGSAMVVCGWIPKGPRLAHCLSGAPVYV